MVSMASQFFAAIFLFFIFESVLSDPSGSNDVAFDVNYNISWGGDHVVSLNQSREVHLTMDRSSGSGFQSKSEYASGFFHVNMKTPSRNAAGTVTTFYLTSHTNAHDELDFEFLGNLEGKPISLQTNVFANGKGDREERINLWFDPSQDFHSYKILWNMNLIVFFVDDIPIRVFLNKSNKGVEYPSQPMQVIASLWNGEDWATNEGETKIDWSYAPFVASYRGFSIDGCAASGSQTQQCYLPKHWWNAGVYTSLSAAQMTAYQQVREKYLTYDYCTDRPRYPIPPPECPQLSS